MIILCNAPDPQTNNLKTPVVWNASYPQKSCLPSFELLADLTVGKWRLAGGEIRVASQTYSAIPNLHDWKPSHKTLTGCRDLFSWLFFARLGCLRFKGWNGLPPKKSKSIPRSASFFFDRSSDANGFAKSLAAWRVSFSGIWICELRIACNLQGQMEKPLFFESAIF